MKTMLLCLAAAGTLAGGLAQADVLKDKGCLNCHEMDKKKVGPAYKDVAAKYKGNAQAATTLMDKVKKGGVGNWGQVPMPPNPAVPDADIKTMVTHILAIK
jgi:cytochrome c